MRINSWNIRNILSDAIFLLGAKFDARNYSFSPEIEEDCRSLCDVQYPNFFSPNGDGINDNLLLFTPLATYYHVTFDQHRTGSMYRIYDFQSPIISDITYLWNGTGFDPSYYPGNVAYMNLTIYDCTGQAYYTEHYAIGVFY